MKILKDVAYIKCNDAIYNDYINEIVKDINLL